VMAPARATRIGCALLLHSSDRDSVRPFWKPLLISVDQHFPPDICAPHFSYELNDTAAKAAVEDLSQPFTLIRRGRREDWVPALLRDLAALSSYRWIFHMMDDAFAPDPISRHSVEAVLDVAEAHNASWLALYHKSFGFWSVNGRQRLQRRYVVDVEAAPGIRTSLHFYSPSFNYSLMVVNQNFALWHRTELMGALALVPSTTSPTSWERAFDPRHLGRRTLFNDSFARALVVRYAGADGMQGIEDMASNGTLKAGWSACSWLRLSSRLGWPPATLPGGEQFARMSGYSFCRSDEAIGDGSKLLHATPKPCDCKRTVLWQAASVECGCG